MKKIPLKLVVLLPFVFIFYSIAFAQTENPGARIKSVKFDKEIVYSWCPANREGYCPKDEENVEVTVEIAGELEKGQEITYLPSGGKIYGEGKKVKWSFSGARPGKYNLIVAITEKEVVHGFVSIKSIEFKECATWDPGCECPTISLLRPGGGILPGDKIIFAAIAVEGLPRNLKYQWQIKNGTIKNGLGTRSIIVEANPETHGELVTATLEISGDELCADCEKTFTGSVQVSPIRPLRISEIKAEKPAFGFFKIEGYISKIYTCPPCPPMAECKPCIGNYVVISEKNKPTKTFPLKSHEMAVFTDNTDQFKMGGKYTLIIRIANRNFLNEAINDAELVRLEIK